jgi:hypothetical protein
MSYTIENYLNEYSTFKKYIVYEFRNIGGIGDMLRFYSFLFSVCMKHKIRLYYLQTGIEIEKYIQLKHKIMYITPQEISHSAVLNIDNIDDIEKLQDNIYYIAYPNHLYSVYNIEIAFSPLNNILYFTDEIVTFANKILNSSNYNSVHLRLGDKFLEVEQQYIICKDDKREYNEDKLIDFFKNNKNIVFFCDNMKYKQKMKELFPDIIVTNLKIGHTALNCTTQNESFNTVVEFYLLSNSAHIYKASDSGFSIMASKFNNIPITNI